MDVISQSEQNEFREMLSKIFGNQAKGWNINLRVLELLEELISKSESCSRYMDSVPRPYYFGDSIKWASKQVRAAIVRHLRNGGDHYLLCLRGAGLGMKTEFVLASGGG